MCIRDRAQDAQNDAFFSTLTRSIEQEALKEGQKVKAKVLNTNDNKISLSMKALEEEMVDTEPVSYTHLDVYKRQARGIPFRKNNRQTVCLGWMSGWTGADNCQRGKKT